MTPESHTGCIDIPIMLYKHCYTVKNILRIYGRIAGNQLSGHVPLFFRGTRKNDLAWRDRKEQGSVTYGA